MNDNSWYSDYVDPEDEQDYVSEYDVTATPNDFNLRTLFDFMERGRLALPAFQRNYVWDRPRASRLIESLLLGLPIPQAFLYQESPSRFLVIDGQQRLLTIYYFMKSRFPRIEKRGFLRKVFDEKGRIPDEMLGDETIFMDFSLYLKGQVQGRSNRFDGLTYDLLSEMKDTFDTRTIRTITVRQNAPEEERDSSIFEIFSRLNTGGMNLSPQEIRACLYRSDFYEILGKVNLSQDWRRFLGKPEPDIRQKDLEILLRSFAMLMDSRTYSPSMTRFLNSFSNRSKRFAFELNAYFSSLFDSFMSASENLSDNTFRVGNRFNIALFEAVFVAVCEPFFTSKALVSGVIDPKLVDSIRIDSEFTEASRRAAASTANLSKRLERARTLLSVSDPTPA